MSPFLSHGDVLWLRRIEGAKLNYGDVVLYTDERGRHIVHRYLGRKMVQGHLILTIKGDAIDHNDPPVDNSEVLAKVVMVCKGRRRIDLEGRTGKLLNVTMALLSSLPAPAC